MGEFVKLNHFLCVGPRSYILAILITPALTFRLDHTAEILTRVAMVVGTTSWERQAQQCEKRAGRRGEKRNWQTKVHTYLRKKGA